MVWCGARFPCFAMCAISFIHVVSSGINQRICSLWIQSILLRVGKTKDLLDEFKKCCWDDNSEDDDEDLNNHGNAAQLLEAVLESTPQFIIQLYAMIVQEEPVKIIQMISVPVSFLSLAWAFTACNSEEFGIYVGRRNVKPQKVVLFVNYLFVLSSRLFAVAFFTITYKWWIISVLMIHNVLILIIDTIWSYRITRVFKGWSDLADVSETTLLFCLHWLRDDMSPTIPTFFNTSREEARIKQRLYLPSNILFVMENCTMILIFYRFSPFSNTWYSLPVTVCVCLFSVIGAVARVAHVCFLTKESNPVNNVNSPVQQNAG